MWLRSMLMLLLFIQEYNTEHRRPTLGQLLGVGYHSSYVFPLVCLILFKSDGLSASVIAAQALSIASYGPVYRKMFSFETVHNVLVAFTSSACIKCKKNIW